MGAGLQLAANGTRALYALGIGEELKALVRAESKEIRIWNSGERWKLHDLGKVSVERYGYPYLTVYRPDLLGALERAVRREKPDAIRLGAKCVGFEQTQESLSVRLEDGKGVEADVLIGADGVHSRIRQGLDPTSRSSRRRCSARHRRWTSCPGTWSAWSHKTGRPRRTREPLGCAAAR